MPSLVAAPSAQASDEVAHEAPELLDAEGKPVQAPAAGATPTEPAIDLARAFPSEILGQRVTSSVKNSDAAKYATRTSAANGDDDVAEDANEEEVTEFSRKTVDESGNVTLDVYATPAFRKDDDQWVELSGDLERDGDVVRAPEMLQPVTFGNDESSIVQLDLPGGPVVMKSSSLEIAEPVLSDGGVLYRDAAEDTDVRYTTGTANVKEDIILRSADAPTKYTFRLQDSKGQLGAPKVLDGGGVLLPAARGRQYSLLIPPAVAWEQSDAGPAPHDPASAHLTVVRRGDGYDITIEVDKQWLEGKTFPIVLDPQVVISSGGSNTTFGPLLDGYAFACANNTCESDVKYQDSVLGAGTYVAGGVDYRVRSYLRYDLKDAAHGVYVPDRANISTAQLVLFYEKCVGVEQPNPAYADLCRPVPNSNDRAYTIGIDRMTASWGSFSLYSYLASQTAASGVADAVTGQRNNNTYFEMAPLLQRWVNFGVTSGAASYLPNYGIQVVNRQDATLGLGGPVFNSNEYTKQGTIDTGTDLSRPMLTIQWTETLPDAPTGLGAVQSTFTSPPTAANLTWTRSMGGTEPSSYQVEIYDPDTSTVKEVRTYAATPCGSNGYNLQACSGTMSQAVTGLTAGETYRFRVRGVNAGPGNVGPWSASATTTLWTAPVLAMTPPAAGAASVVGDQSTWSLRVTNPNDRAYRAIGAIGFPSGTIPVPGTGKIDSTVCNVTLINSPLADNTCYYLMDVLNNPSVSYGIPNIAAGGYHDLKFDVLTTTGGLTACLQRSFAVWVPTYQQVSTSATFNAATNAPLSCGSGLGLERWWSTVDRPVGPNGTARVNVANGNLVLQHEDSAPMQGHGQLAYSLRRTFNSQAPSTLPLSGLSLGQGWSFNVSAAGDLATAGVTADGLIVPTDLSSGWPLDLGNIPGTAVTLIDRDGTRHSFTPQATTLSANALASNLTLSSPTSVMSALSGLNLNVGSLTSILTSLSSRFTEPVSLCVATAYNPPKGVHLSLWRYIAVPTSAGTCAPAPSGQSGQMNQPLVIGYATMRPDRVRQVYDMFGRQVALFDRSGNELRYSYSASGLSAVWEPAACPDATNVATTPTIPSSCRALRFDYANGDVAVTDPSGRKTVYDKVGTFPSIRLATVVTSDSLGNEVERWKYRYNGDQGTTYCTGPSGALCDIYPYRSLQPTTGNVTGPSTALTYTATSGVPKVASIVERMASVVIPVERRIPTAMTTFNYQNVGTSTAYTDVVRDGRAIRYGDIDIDGRVARVREGTLSGTNILPLRDTLYGWDGSTTCRETDQRADNNLCSMTEMTGALPDGWAAPSGWVAASDTKVTYRYTPLGELLVEAEGDSQGNVARSTTYGYRALYYTAGSTEPHWVA